MLRIDRLRRGVAAVFLVLAAWGAQGCKSGSCDYAGRSYDDGDQWMCSDGCNYCSCMDGDLAQTARACGTELDDENVQSDGAAGSPQD